MGSEESKEKWEVSLFDDLDPNPIFKKSGFASKESSLEFIRKVFSTYPQLYTGTIWNRAFRHFSIHYRNSEGESIDLDSFPFVLTREEAEKLRVVNGKIIGFPKSYRNFIESKEKDERRKDHE